VPDKYRDESLEKCVGKKKCGHGPMDWRVPALYKHRKGFEAISGEIQWGRRAILPGKVHEGANLK